MILSRVLAWITVVLSVLEVLKFVARISKIKVLNRFFHKIHIPFGVLMLIVGGIHGVLAGNFPDTTLSDFEFAPVLFTFNFGTFCYICVIILGLTYLLREKIKKLWMILHRIFTVIFIALLVLHMVAVGIELPKMLFVNNKANVGAEVTEPSGVSESTGIMTSVGEEVTEPETSEAVTETEARFVFSGAVLRDGTYDGTARGRNGDITVRATVNSGQVTDITVLSHIETPKYFDRAIRVSDSIVDSQSLTVDAVSGATISSNGIKNAVYNALSPAVISGELEIRSY